MKVTVKLYRVSGTKDPSGTNNWQVFSREIEAVSEEDAIITALFPLKRDGVPYDNIKVKYIKDVGKTIDR